MLREQLISSTDGAVNVAVAGDGPPLVLLHGVTRAWQDYGWLIGALATRWRVLALDFRGHGRSQATPGRYRVLDYVDDALTLLEREAHEPAVVYGHSLGAMVALAAAAMAPARVRGVALEDPPFETMGSRIGEAWLLEYFRLLAAISDRRASVAQTARALADLPVAGPPGSPPKRLGDVRDAANMRLAARCLVAADPAISEPILAGRWLEGYDLATLIPRVQAPLLLMQGNPSLGAMLIDEDADRLRRGVADCTFVRFENAGHQLHGQQPEAVLRLIYSFIDSLDEPAPRAANSEIG